MYPRRFRIGGAEEARALELQGRAKRIREAYLADRPGAYGNGHQEA